jgi:hypothetical protein
MTNWFAFSDQLTEAVKKTKNSAIPGSMKVTRENRKLALNYLEKVNKPA